MANTGLPTTLEQFIKGIGNFQLLKAQKTVLLNMMATNSFLSEAETSAVDGIVHLIDEIQDIAVEQFGYSTNQVFNHPKGDDDYVLTLDECKRIVITGEAEDAKDEVYYQPDLTTNEFIQGKFLSHYVYADKNNAIKAWPTHLIKEYKNDDIEDREYID
jgi:hypothetical protein